MDITINANTTLDYTISVVDENNSPIDLTNSQIFWGIFNPDTKADILKKSVGNGITISTSTTNQCTISLSTDDTKPLLGSYIHQGRVVLSNGKSGIIAQGAFVVDQTYV